MTGSRRGSVTVLLIAWVGIATLLLLAVARVGGAAALQARADAAADASALAAAGALARGESAGSALGAARRVATANGATLRWCTCRGDAVAVEVRIRPSGPLAGLGELRARAHAEIAWPDAGG